MKYGVWLWSVCAWYKLGHGIYNGCRINAWIHLWQWLNCKCNDWYTDRESSFLQRCIESESQTEFIVPFWHAASYMEYGTAKLVDVLNRNCCLVVNSVIHNTLRSQYLTWIFITRCILFSAGGKKGWLSTPKIWHS